MKDRSHRRAAAAKTSLEFFKGFLKNPREVGSVIPSSRFLTRRTLECGEVRQAGVIVELGPGTGVLTRHALERMRADAKLVAIEISRDFVELLQKEFPDPRLFVHHGSATEIEAALAKIGARQADLVMSGIPFSTLERGVGLATLRAAKRVLAPGGRFVAYQFRSKVRDFGEPVFGTRAETHSGFWNVPPMKIYVWRQAGTPA
ncbi:MAG TPA: methyltransferase domain-containing protein [Myxococcota bacterium]|nr:methyltransferase domain-containing protein [Myxococcota bacterium]